MNPEIEEKLLNLQRFQEKKMKTDHPPTSTSLAHNHHEYTSPMKSTSSRKRPSSRTQDGDWIVETPKRRPPKANSSSEKKNHQATVDASIDVNRIIQSVEEETAVIEGRAIPVDNVATMATVATTPAKSAKTTEKTAKTPEKPATNRQLAAMKRESKKKAEQKRQVSKSGHIGFYIQFYQSIANCRVSRRKKMNSNLFIWFSFSFRLRLLLFYRIESNDVCVCVTNAIEEIVSSKGTIEKRHFEKTCRSREGTSA